MKSLINARGCKTRIPFSQAMRFAVLAMTIAALGNSGCSQPQSSPANNERWNSFNKENGQIKDNAAKAFERRQQQLAAKRAHAPTPAGDASNSKSAPVAKP